MQQLTPQGLQKINELAQRYTVSPDVVMTLLHAVVNGNGMMAQFEHEELGGRGQWMRGGMVMVGEMFNHALKAKVDGLCSELSTLLAAQGSVAKLIITLCYLQLVVFFTLESFNIWYGL